DVESWRSSQQHAFFLQPTERDSGMGDGLGGSDEIRQQHTLVRCWPLFVDANVTGAVLDGRNTEYFLDHIAVADVTDPAVRADVGWLAGGESLALGQHLDQPVVRRTQHWGLVPGGFGAFSRNLHNAIEGGVRALDVGEDPVQVRLD